MKLRLYYAGIALNPSPQQVYHIDCKQAYDDTSISGITRVGVTRGGNWRCRPYFFFEKLMLITVTFFISVGVSPRTFLSLRPRFSTVLCKFRQNCFHLGDILQGATPKRKAVRPCPPSDATDQHPMLYSVLNLVPTVTCLSFCSFFLYFV